MINAGKMYASLNHIFKFSDMLAKLDIEKPGLYWINVWWSF